MDANEPSGPHSAKKARLLPGATRAERRLWALAVAVTALATIWAGLFIAKSSIVAFDGKRYFCLFDDAMVSMRYAWNLAHGNGLVWNAGEPVEGYTSVLMTLIMTLPQLFLSKSLAVLAIQLLGLGFCLGSVWLTWHLARRFSISSEPSTVAVLAAPLAVLLVVTDYPFWYWSLLGMETGLLTLLVTAAAAVTLKAAHEPEGRLGFKAGGLFSAILLTRPDGALFVAVFVAYFFLVRPGRLATRTRALLPALICVVPVLAQLAFRVLYYGELLPNTYVLKATGVPFRVRIHGGLLYVGPYLAHFAEVFTLLASSLLLSRRREGRLVLALVGVALVYQVSVGGDAWPRWRIFAPVTPVLFALCASELARLASRYRAKSLALGGALLLILLANRSFPDEWRLDNIYNGNDINEHSANLAAALDAVTTDAAVVGFFCAGTAPYYLTPRRAIDFLGRSDKHVARLPPHIMRRDGLPTLPGHNKYDLSYSIGKLKPTFIEGYDWFDDNVLPEVSRTYVAAWFGPVRLLLRKDAPEVRWDKVTRAQAL